MSLIDDLTLRITELERKLQRLETGEVMKASEAVDGAIELATQTEVNTGTDAVRAVTPATLKSRIETADAAKVSKLYASDLSPIALEANNTGELSTETGTQLSTVEFRADTNDDADTKIAMEAYKPAGTASRLTHIRWNQNTRKMTRLSQHPTIPNGRGGTDTIWHMRLMEGAYNSTTYEPLVRDTFGCSVKRTSDLALTGGVFTYVSWQAYMENPHSVTWWDSGTSIYAPVSGWYIAALHAPFVVSVTSDLIAALVSSSAGVFAMVRNSGVGSVDFMVSAPIYLIAGAYIYANVYSSNNATLSVSWTPPLMSLVKI